MQTVELLRLDPDLAEAIPENRRDAAIRACSASAFDLARGSWEWAPEDGRPADGRHGFGLLVLSGVLCRRVAQIQQNGAELVGPSDLLRPWDRVGDWSTIPTESSWIVIRPARIAVLDAPFSHRAAPFPEIAETLVRRALLRSRYLAILLAIISQRRIETRLTMLFWHLADRFGRRRGDWVEIPVPLTHGLIAELLGARRPSVTTALSKLQQRGVVLRAGEGWRLSGSMPPEYQPLQIGASADP